jgi:hypothetical protein
MIAETEQAGKDAMEDQKDKDKENAFNALVRAGEVPFLIPSPTSSEVQGPRKATKAIKAPILSCVSHPISHSVGFKTHAYDLGITNKRAQDPLRIPDAMIDIHLHLPAGGQKKDGPSAGVAMVCNPVF